MTETEARTQALAARDASRLEPTSLVTYRSGGKIVVVGDDEALRHCTELPAGLALTPLSSSAATLAVDGYLGAFQISFTDASGEEVVHQADAVLDLHPAPLLKRELPPPGYFHAPPDSWADSDIGAELGDLTGEFEKPRYFDYDASICAHGVNGKTVCTRCIDACPAEAIASIGERIEVNPFLCQGGGACSTVCPSGAIRYLYPTLRDNAKRLRKTLQAYREHGGERARILFHAEEHDPATCVEADATLLPIAVEELASVGADLVLAALASGAQQVLLLADDALPARSRGALERQLDWLHALLDGLGLESACVALCREDAVPPAPASANGVTPSELDLAPGKREAIYQSLDHLVVQLKPTVDKVDLPPTAPFGEMIIDADKCTLCMACVGACPGRALQDGSNRAVPEVLFIESNCLQCGACVQTCPEDAVALRPRLLFDRESRIRQRTLNQDKPFACIACGKPFAPTSVIHKMQEKLKDHYMFDSTRALDRLKMCEDCRVVDIVEDPEAMGGQFDPLKNFKQ